jgi:hypothetical protein
MDQIKLSFMVLITLTVIAFGAFLVPMPGADAHLHSTAQFQPAVPSSLCVPNDTQWVCP